MKKALYIGILVLVVIAGIACALSKGSQRSVAEDNKILIAYFSHTGNTKLIAEKIQAQTGGELFEIKTKEAYPADYKKTTEIAQKQIADDVLPELTEYKDTLEYETIFIGTPVWGHTMAPAVKAFLKSDNFEGKVIIPFISHGGGGEYEIADEIAKIAEGAKVAEPFVVQEKGGLNIDNEIKNWLNRIGL